MRTVPEDLPTLTKDLGVSAKQLRRLQAAHGDKLLRTLQRQWRRRCREHPRFLSSGPVAATEKRRQKLSAEESLGYSATPFGSIDTLEALSKEDQEAQSKAAGETWDLYVERHRPKERLASDLRVKSDRVRRLKAEAIKRGIDVRTDFDDFVTALEAKLSVPVAKEA